MKTLLVITGTDVENEDYSEEDDEKDSMLYNKIMLKHQVTTINLTISFMVAVTTTLRRKKSS